MIPPPSVSRFWAGGIFDRPHLLAFLDFYFFSIAIACARAMKKNKRAQGPSPSAPNKSLSTIVPPFLTFAISGCKLLF